MIISVNWLKKFTDIDVSVQELATLIGARLVEIEGIENLGEKLQDVLAVKVIECVPVEGSDHLNVTKIDDGGVAQDVERDDNGYVQVVCGAPNVKAGMFVAWLPPGSTVPETFGTKEPFVLGARKLQGFISNGMLASAKELDLFDDHTGILEIDKDAQAGESFAQLYELNDYLLDVENKSLTHRPDAFGIIGFAREVAAIQGKQFKTPDWLADIDAISESNGILQAPMVTIDDPNLSDRFQAVVLTDANEAAMSPLQMQTYLSRSGIRPISAVVDVTNYLMLLAGRPLHAYDYDKLLNVAGGKIDLHVRSARKDETLKLLDGRVLQLDPGDIVIANGDVAVALAGAMGGAETEIDSNTTRILIECATFNLYSLRSTQMRHGVFSEAITRLTKGVPGELGNPVLVEAVRMMGEFAGAKAASPIADAFPGKKEATPIVITATHISDVLGKEYSAQVIKKTLEDAEFTVQVEGETLAVTAPYWRHDIAIAEDIIEEVGRINAYDSIPLTLPARTFAAVLPEPFDDLSASLRSLLVRAGANEVLTYSFVHGDMMTKAAQSPDTAYRITNSISPDLQYYRQSLSPSLLTNIHANIKSGYDHFALFELNKFHTKIHPLTDEQVPLELASLAFVVARSKKQKTAAYYEAKRYLDYLAEELHLDLVYEPLEQDSNYPVSQPYEPKRSARVWDRATRERVGVVGEFKRSVAKAFKLPDHAAGFEISPWALMKLTLHQGSFYAPSSKFPGVERDICFQVNRDETYQQIIDSAKSHLATTALETSIIPTDIYQPEEGSTKNITVRVRIASYEKTLTGEEANSTIDAVIKAVVSATSAVVV